MKKSERYFFAMKAVLRAGYSEEATIEILDTLMSDRSMAEYSEEIDARKEADAE